MIEREIQRLLGQEPFEPFRINLLSGEHFDIFDPGSLVSLASGVFFAAHNGNWAVFPYTSVSSLESLFDDFQGDRAAHGG